MRSSPTHRCDHDARIKNPLLELEGSQKYGGLKGDEGDQKDP